MLAEHDGFFAYTIGQRKGLNLQRPAPDGRPRYVLGIEPVTGTVTVGPASRTGCTDDHRGPAGVLRAATRRGSRCGPSRNCGRTAAPCRGSADLVDGRIRLTLDEPVRAVAPGQTVVLYDAGDDYVIGAGTIVRAA